VLFAENSNSVVERKLVVNFPVLGKKHGGLMKDILVAVGGLSSSDVEVYERDGVLSLNLNSGLLKLGGDDLRVQVKDMPGYLTAQSNGLLVTLNTHISKELEAEGYTREFVNRVQNVRKEIGLVVTNRIVLSIFGDEGALKMIKPYEKYISQELLVDSIVYLKSAPKNSFLFEFNNFKLYIGVELV
jgi:isoleucyl-tRNA synthetase